MLSFSLLILLKPFNDGLVQPLAKRLPGIQYVRTSKPCRWRGNRLHYGGNVCVLCIASQKPYVHELFIPTRTNLGVKFLRASGERDTQMSWTEIKSIGTYFVVHQLQNKYRGTIFDRK